MKSREFQAWDDQSCRQCAFVATIANKVDLWICAGDRMTTVIARFGGKDHEYASNSLSSETFAREVGRLTSRYAGRRDDDNVRRHAIVELAVALMPSVVLNMTKFPGESEPVLIFQK